MVGQQLVRDARDKRKQEAGTSRITQSGDLASLSCVRQASLGKEGKLGAAKQVHLTTPRNPNSNNRTRRQPRRHSRCAVSSGASSSCSSWSEAHFWKLRWRWNWWTRPLRFLHLEEGLGRTGQPHSPGLVGTGQELTLESSCCWSRSFW